MEEKYKNVVLGCQNCKKDFTIEPDDFSFYEKMQVPAPTFCPDCRFQRRLMFRNERVLYKRTCDLCKKSMITIFSPDKKAPVFCGACWWGDGWDPKDYGMVYDPTRPFLEQLKELTEKVPCMNLVVDYSSLIRSDYINHAGACKDTYLIFNADYAENVLYSSTVTHTRDSMDVIMISDSELLYECIDCSGSRVFFSENCNACVDVYFSKDCSGCVNCFACAGLRNKSYCIGNIQYTKEAYDAYIRDAHLDSYEHIQHHKETANDVWRSVPRRAYYGTQNVGSTGDYIFECKNAKQCYQATGVEDGAYCQIITLKSARDTYDLTEWGMNSERVVDSITVGENCVDVKYCAGAWANCRGVEYCMYAVGSKDCFGCVNVRKQEYCILNTQYTKDEYEALRAEIVAAMTEHPYRDAAGRVFWYGEFLPYDLSFFDYNETHAAQFFPLTKEEALDRGYRWKEAAVSVHVASMTSDALPDSMHTVSDSITEQIISCGSCERPYRIVVPELALLRRFGFPLPRQCPDCRHMERLSRMNPPKLWRRTCMNEGCSNEFETSYAPNRPEIVYCESCYQKEVI